MESLDLTYKLVDLKVRSKTPDQIYFMSQVLQEHSHYNDKKKIKKIKIRKTYLFLQPLLPTQDGGLMQHPSPQLCSGDKILIYNWYIRYMGIWTKGGKIQRMTNLAEKQKRHEGKSEGEVATTPPPLPLPFPRERVKLPIIATSRILSIIPV